MAHRTRQGSRSKQAFPDCNGIIRQWEIILSEQYLRTASRSPVSGDYDPRQRIRYLPVIDNWTANSTPAPGNRLFNGCAASFPMGGKLSGFYGSNRCYRWHGEDLWSRVHSP